uniref:Protein kinase domain-containing protein n=1 Tax=Globisporangium ultimum (strain ATCC 200006 / CBS 805.95 / DAOM BR144) TaxID=431595 RepID=K3X965_GLOUD
MVRHSGRGQIHRKTLARFPPSYCFTKFIWHRLNHPHIAKLYGACHVDKRYFVCEYAPNGDLQDYLKVDANKHLTWQKMHEVAVGLEYLDGQNIAHNERPEVRQCVDWNG